MESSWGGAWLCNGGCDGGWSAASWCGSSQHSCLAGFHRLLLLLLSSLLLLLLLSWCWCSRPVRIILNNIQINPLRTLEILSDNNTNTIRLPILQDKMSVDLNIRDITARTLDTVWTLCAYWTKNLNIVNYANIYLTRAWMLEIITRRRWMWGWDVVIKSKSLIVCRVERPEDQITKVITNE